MSDCPMLISNKLHSFRNFYLQRYLKTGEPDFSWYEFLITYRMKGSILKGYKKG